MGFPCDREPCQLAGEVLSGDCLSSSWCDDAERMCYKSRQWYHGLQDEVSVLKPALEPASFPYVGLYVVVVKKR